MKKRSISLLLALLMLVSAFPALSMTAMAAEETTAAAEETKEAAEESPEKVILDYNCDSLTDKVLQLQENVYPNTYIMDSRKEEIEEGTLRVGANGKLNGTASVKFPLDITADAPSFALDLTMKVNSLARFDGDVWRGFIFEIYIPGNRMLHISFQDMGEADENGKNATVMMMKKGRSDSEALNQRIAIPTDGEFHEWQILFNGTNEVRILIDGKVEAKLTDITANSDKKEGYMLLKSVMGTAKEGVTDVVIDHIKMTTGVTIGDSEILGAKANLDASSKKLIVTTTVNKLPEDAEITVSVTPASDPTKAVKKSYKPEKTTSDVEFTDLPFSGISTVEIQMTNTPSYSFKQYLYEELTYLTEAGKLKNEAPNKAVIFNKMDLAERPEDSMWDTNEYVTSTGTKGTALYFPGVNSKHSFTVPVELTGKYAVYIGYVAGTRELTVNDKNVFIAFKGATPDRIREVFALADDFDGGKVTVTNNPGISAQVAYVKYVSLTDEQYELYLKEDTSTNLMKDEDGYSMFTNETYGKPDAFVRRVAGAPHDQYNLTKFNFAVFSTSILNYNSEVWWKYVYARMEELGIPKEKAPKDFLSHINMEGEAIDYSEKMRNADVRAFNSIRSLNEHGIPHVILADYVAENGLGETYVSLRMSHFSGLNGAYAFQTGTLYHLHPEWARGGSSQASYIHEEYRNYIHDLLIEMATPENVTGITMDYGRYQLIFGTELTDVKKRTEIVNEFIKSVRDDLPEGKVLVARVLNPTDEKAIAFGLDYKHWVKEGWVDRIIISDQSHETFFNFDEYMEFFKDYPDVEFYLGINGTLTGHDTTKEEEAIREAGGYVEGKTLVSGESFMLRAYDAYMAGADGIFIFNGPSSDELIGGIPPYYAYMNNKTLMEKWYTFEYPQSMFTEAITFVSEKGRIEFDYDCTSLTNSILKVQTNTIPSFYFADSETEIEAEVKEGTVLMAGDGKETGYCTMNFPISEDITAYTLDLEVKVDSLAIPSKNNIWRGFVIEVGIPGKPSVFMSFHALENASGGNNAKVSAMTTVRGTANLAEAETNIPMDGKFHKWEIDFDGGSTLTFSIDGKEILKADNVTNPCTAKTASVQIRNVMIDIGKGENNVTFDRVTMTTRPSEHASEEKPETAETEKPAAGVADPAGKEIAVTVEGKKKVLDLPVSKAAWDAAPSPTADDTKTGKYKNTGKTAKASYVYDEKADKLTIDITYDFNFWIQDAALVDKNDKEVAFTTESKFGKGGTLWHFHYVDNGAANATKVLTLTVDNVKELPDSYVFYVSNYGTNTVYTAKLTLDFTKAK